MAEDPPDKFKLRAARTTFFTHILKRPTYTVPAVRYEDTTIAYEINTTMAPPNKRFKLFRSRSDDAEGSVTDSESPESKIPLLVRFYDPEIQARDAVGRTLDDILAWEDMRLENSHNYIQMLFPLPEGSIFNMQAPVVTREVMEAFLALPELRARLRKSWERMLSFYGFFVQYPDGRGEKAEEQEQEQVDGEESDGSEDKTEVELDVDELQLKEKELEVEYEEESHNDVHGVLIAPSSARTSVQTAVAEGVKGQGTLTQVNEQAAIPIADEPSTGATDAIAAISRNSRINPSRTDESAPSARQPSIAGMTGLPFPMSYSNGAVNQEQPHYESLIPGVKVIRGPHWKQAFRNWAVRFDHNHLRMTRILRCLRILGLEHECKAFYVALYDAYNDPNIHINDRTMNYWRKAVEKPLHIAPDGERVEWLRRWCNEREELERHERLANGESPVEMARSETPFNGKTMVEEQKGDEEMAN